MEVIKHTNQLAYSLRNYSPQTSTSLFHAYYTSQLSIPTYATQHDLDFDGLQPNLDAGRQPEVFYLGRNHHKHYGITSSEHPPQYITLTIHRNTVPAYATHHDLHANLII